MFGVVAACALFASALIAAGMYFLSGVSLAADGSALARVSLQPLAGSLVSVRATALTEHRFRLLSAVTS